jgi:CRISPR-associated endonuclease Cas2
MTQKRLLYLICYDITENRGRKKTADLLIQNGYERLQYSVFIGVHHPGKLKGLWQKLQQNIKENDKLIVINIHKKAFLKMKKIGILPFDKNYLAGEKNTLFFND